MNKIIDLILKITATVPFVVVVGTGYMILVAVSKANQKINDLTGQPK